MVTLARNSQHCPECHKDIKPLIIFNKDDRGDQVTDIQYLCHKCGYEWRIS